jgi:heme/copper-type cytochrome/quinol oxidase subunit 2
MATGKPLSAVRPWLGWMALAVAALAVAFVPLPSSRFLPVERHIRLEASSFEYSPAVISVNPGDRVTIELASSDVVHGFYLDGYGLSVTADPGQPARLTFVASRPGTFRFRCSVTCGPLHPFMAGKLQVGPDWLFWRAVGLAALAAIGGAILANRRSAAGWDERIEVKA